MEFLTFNGKKCTSGISMDAMVKLFSKTAKELGKNATLDDLPGKMILVWAASAGAGTLEVTVDGKTETTAFAAAKKDHPPFFLPGNCTVRLAPDAGAPTVLAISPQGDVAQAQGDTPPPAPHAPRATDTAEQAAARHWLFTGNTGRSSRTMAHFLTGVPEQLRDADISHPLDPSDFLRCLEFLEVVPEAKNRLADMSAVSPAWAALVPVWPELEALHQEEKNQKKAPKLYARMQTVLYPQGRSHSPKA